jgi:hypothetical protein
MTPNETEKIKLMQLFRQGKIDTLPDVDNPEYKAQKIRTMLDKEKSMEEDYQMDGAVYSRIDGLVDQSLLKSFLNTFKEINADLIADGENFDIDDLVDYLTIQLDKESRRSGTYLEEEVNEEKTISITKDQMDKLHKGEPVKLGNNSFLYKVDAPKKEGVNEGDPIVDETEFNFFKEFFGIGSDNVIPNTNATDKEIEAYLKSDDYQEELKYSDLEEKDIANWVESFLDWRSKNTLQEADGGVEFFKRIAFKK